MSEARWNRIEELFHAAADLPPSDRERYLASACAADAELRQEVESLLAADADPGSVVESAVAEAAAEMSEAAEGPLRVGSRVGPYAIVGLIGRGGMGAVYRGVREGEFRMEVALKLLKRGTDTEASLGRFRKERQILAALQHPNIARLLDGGATDDGLPYFAMEYVEGRPLLEYAAPLPIRERLTLFRSVCAAVQYAHQNLVVHRDLKPGNILVTSEGAPKLLDFGIARLMDPEEGGATLTVAGARLLTPEYASPEQVRGEAVGVPSDIYSLGVILYELLTGERPHRLETHSPEAIEREICREDPKKPSTRNRQIDPDLDNIVLMALRKEPQRRYGSVEQLSDDVGRYLENRPVRARKDTIAYRTERFIRRNRLGLAAAAVALAGLATGVVAVRRQARRAEYRFRQVRGLAHTVLFELNPEIENLAGSTKAREVLVKTSLEYLDSLASEAGDDRGLQLELAEAYEKIGDVQGNPKFANLGHPDQSIRSYGKALGIARKLGASRPALELLARAYSKTGTILGWEMGRFSEARENLRLAVRVAESLPARTGDPAYEARADAWGLLGDVDPESHPELSKEPYRRSLEIAREWAASRRSPESRFFLARAQKRWGIVLLLTGDVTGALDFDFAALRIIDELRKEQPTSAVLAWRQAMHWEDIGKAFGDPEGFNLGDRRAAETWLQKAVEGVARIAATDPDDWNARQQLAIVSSELAAVIGESDPGRAEPLLRRALEEDDATLRSTPIATESWDDEAGVRVRFARVLQRLGRSAQALAQLNDAVGMREKLLRKDPAHVAFGLNLGVALAARAAQRQETGDVVGSRADFDEALGILEPMFRANPYNLLALRDLAECRRGLGDLLAGRSDWKGAELEYRRSLDLWDHWKQIGTSSIYDRQRRDAIAVLVARAAEKDRRASLSR